MPTSRFIVMCTLGMVTSLWTTPALSATCESLAGLALTVIGGACPAGTARVAA